jgi:hypothetical protein
VEQGLPEKLILKIVGFLFLIPELFTCLPRSIFRRTTFMLRTLSALFLLLILSVSVFAQVQPVPQLMNFQGRLTKPDGTPVANGNYSVRFSLFDALTGGTEKWNQTVNPVAVRDGTFAVLLTGFPAGAFHGNLWLEIKVGDALPLTPRQQLVSVAYAMKADSVKDGSITSASIANGTLTAEDFTPDTFNPMAWLLGGNSGTNPTTHFLGTTDNQPLNFRVNNLRGLRLEYVNNIDYANGLNVVGGFWGNLVAPGVVGSIVLGGSGYDATAYNRAFDHANVVGGGEDNTAGSNDGDPRSAYNATVGGGYQNTASNRYATVGGGTRNTASGRFATVAGGLDNTASGYASFAAGFFAQANHEGTFVWADRTGTSFASTGLNQFLIRAGGGVGINTNNPAGFALNVAGNIQCVNLTQTSDARYKQNIATVDKALDNILNLRGVTFDWKEDVRGRNFPDGRQVGFIAQEVEKVLPELVTTDQNGYKSVAYANVVPILVEAMKQQQQQMQAKLAQKDTEITDLRAKLNALAAAVAELQAQRK